MGNQLFARKPLSMLLEEAKGENRLRRVLGPLQLTSLGVGAIIGTGIFVLTGVAAHDKTGPALMLSFVAAGLVCVFAALNIETPVSDAFRQAGLPWMRLLVSLGAVAGITSVLLVMMLSQPRVWLAMARDGLFPRQFFGAIHDKHRTPWKSTILTGVVVAGAAALLPLRILADLTNIGTLFAFVVVCAAVLIMRIKHPEAHRPFRVPFSPLTPILGIATCLVLMFSLPPENWYRLGIWLALGFAIYFGYGKKHSVMAKLARGEKVS